MFFREHRGLELALVPLLKHLALVHHVPIQCLIYPTKPHMDGGMSMDGGEFGCVER